MMKQEQVYSSIHRLAKPHIPDCTVNQVKRIAKRFHDRNTTRIHYAFILYWQLSEKEYEAYPAEPFLRLLKELVEADQKKSGYKQVVRSALKNFWIEQGPPPPTVGKEQAR